VLVTGASGFVGRPVVDALVADGHEVHAVSRHDRPRDGTVVWHQADLLSSSRVVGDVAPEVLVHLAWYAEHGGFWSSIENVRWVEASLALLRSFVAAGGRRVVMTGTCAEYDWSRAVFREEAPCAPATLYGTCKHALHQIATAMTAPAGVSLAWARLFFLYGPYEPAERFVPSIIRSLLAGERASTTSGKQRRDFMHVSDAGTALATLAASELIGPINVASGEGVSLRDLGAMIAADMGRPDLLNVGALPSREGDPPSLVAATRRLSDELGFRPSVGLRTGVQDTVAWWSRQAGNAVLGT
jgi:nucleoside-diphosphate-sugar epimerase